MVLKTDPGGGCGGANELMEIWVGVLHAELTLLDDDLLFENTEYCEVADGGVTGATVWPSTRLKDDEENGCGDLGVLNDKWSYSESMSSSSSVSSSSVKSSSSFEIVVTILLIESMCFQHHQYY